MKYRLTDKYKQILCKDASKLLVPLYEIMQDYATTHTDDEDIALFKHLNLAGLELHLCVNNEATASDSFANVELDYAPGTISSGAEFKLFIEFLLFIPTVPNTYGPSPDSTVGTKFVLAMRHRFDQLKKDMPNNIYSAVKHPHLQVGTDNALYKTVYPQAHRDCFHEDWWVLDVPVCAVVTADDLEEVV